MAKEKIKKVPYRGVNLINLSQRARLTYEAPTKEIFFDNLVGWYFITISYWSNTKLVIVFASVDL